MTKIVVALLMLGTSYGTAWAAPQNPQLVMSGSFFPVFVNNTGTNQTIVSGGASYVDQTQYTPVTASGFHGLSSIGAGK